MSTFVSPVRDIFIKYLFGTEENKDLLISFINAVLEDSDFSRIIQVELKNPFNYKTFSIEKESILDVKAIDEKGRIYDIEVQANGFHYFEKRSLYYWAKLYSSQLYEGHYYTKLEPVICINLIDGTIFKELNRLHTCFLLTEKNNSEYVLTDHLMIHFLEIEKLADQNVKGHLRKWIDFFSKEGKEDMTILLKDDPVLEKAHESYEKFTKNDQLLEMYEAREKWKRDYESGLHAAMEEGMEKGREEGREEGMEKGKKKGKVEDALKMLEKGYPLEDISYITGLTIEEIENLDEKNK